MTAVIVNDASCLIDLRKGQLLSVLTNLPFRFVVPLPIRESELLDFTEQDWRVLDAGGMETFDLPPHRVAEAIQTKNENAPLSANDCFCLVAARCHENSILLTGDRPLRNVAKRAGLHVHGVLWIIDQLHATAACNNALLVTALETWRADRSVFLPSELIEERLKRLR